MIKLRQQHQKLLRLRILQERVEEENVSLAQVRLADGEAIIEQVDSCMRTTYLGQLRSMESGDHIDAAFNAQSLQLLGQAFAKCQAVLELRKKEYLQSLSSYVAAKIERSKAGCIAADSDAQWKELLRRREQIALDDAFLCKRSKRD